MAKYVFETYSYFAVVSRAGLLCILEAIGLDLSNAKSEQGLSSFYLFSSESIIKTRNVSGTMHPSSVNCSIKPAWSLDKSLYKQGTFVHSTN